MANELCSPATQIRPTTATLHGTADSIPPGEFIRIAYGTVTGGPYLNETFLIAGTNTIGQAVAPNVTGLENNTTYYYVIQHIAADGTTVLGTSGECSLTTTDFNPACAFFGLDGQTATATLQVSADFVPPESQLQIVWGTSPGVYPNILASAPGNNTAGQTLTTTFANIPPCATIYFAAKINDIPAEYIVDWQYAHMNRLNGTNETSVLTLGDQADFPANQVVVDTDVRADQGTWHVKTGTFPLPSGINDLRMGFTGTGGAPNIGNYLDSCSIVLRTAGGTLLGEQIVNGSFELPLTAPGRRIYCQVLPNGGYQLVFGGTNPIVWQTTAPDGLIELWNGPSDFDCVSAQPNLPIVANTGIQWAELNANYASELFQVVHLDKKSELSSECNFVSTQVTCSPATNIGKTTAELNGTACGIYAGTFTQFQFGTTPGGPYPLTSPLVLHNGEDSQVLLHAAVDLECNKTYYYKVVAYSKDSFPKGKTISESTECSLTTNPCVEWCGGQFDQANCEFVDTPNDDYFNCNNGI